MTSMRATFPTRTRVELNDCFEETATDVFAWTSKLVDGDLSRAQTAFAGVYAHLRDMADRQSMAEVSTDWLFATAYALASANPPVGGELTVRERALLELVEVRRRNPEDTARILDISPTAIAGEVGAATAKLHSSLVGVDMSTVLRRGELWLDDETMQRGRSAALADGSPSAAPGRVWNDNSYGEQTTAAAVPPRRPLVKIGAACGVVVLVVALVAWVGSDDPDTGTTASPLDSLVLSTTTTTGSASTSSTPRFTVPEPQPEFTLGPGYILDAVPDGWVPSGAYEQTPEQWNQQTFSGQFQLWAEPGATRTSGRWLAIATSQCQYFGWSFYAGAARIDINGNNGIIMSQPDGVRRLISQTASPTAMAGGNDSVSIVSFGLSTDELIVIAASAMPAASSGAVESASQRCSGGGGGDDIPQAALPTADLLVGMDLLVSAPSPWGDVSSQLYGGEQRSTSYTSSDGTKYISLTTRPQTGTRQILSQFLRQGSTDPAAPQTPDRIAQIGDRQVIVSTDVSFDGYSDYVNNALEWEEAGETITLEGNASLDVMLGLVPSVRLATEDEWIDLATPDNVPPQTVDVQPQPSYSTLGSSTTTNGVVWQLSMSDDPLWIRLAMEGPVNSGSGTVMEQPLTLDPLQPVHELNTIDTTVLVVTIDAPGKATAVKVTAGGITTVSQLKHVPGSTLFGAIAAFSELPPYTVELIGGPDYTPTPLATSQPGP